MGAKGIIEYPTNKLTIELKFAKEVVNMNLDVLISTVANQITFSGSYLINEENASVLSARLETPFTKVTTLDMIIRTPVITDFTVEAIAAYGSYESKAEISYLLTSADDGITGNGKAVIQVPNQKLSADIMIKKGDVSADLAISLKSLTSEIKFDGQYAYSDKYTVNVKLETPFFEPLALELSLKPETLNFVATGKFSYNTNSYIAEASWMVTEKEEGMALETNFVIDIPGQKYLLQNILSRTNDVVEGSIIFTSECPDNVKTATANIELNMFIKSKQADWNFFDNTITGDISLITSFEGFETFNFHIISDMTQYTS